MNDNHKAKTTQTNLQVSIPSSATVKVDEDFSAFIEQFSKDKKFQLNRTKFPLRIKQYDIENDKDTIIFIQQSAFKLIDFRKNKSGSQDVRWNQEVILHKNQRKARIEIRGIENGIAIDYHFDKWNGKWMLVGVDDSST